MSIRLVARTLSPLLVALAVACGGGSRQVESTVTQSPDYDFAAVETFSIVPLAPPAGLEQGGPVFAARYDLAFANALRGELTARGLTEAAAGETGDLAFTFSYGGVERVAQGYVTEDTVLRIPSVEGKLVVTALDGDDLETIAWQNDVAFDQEGEWGPIEEAEANAPRDVASLLRTFPIPPAE